MRISRSLQIASFALIGALTLSSAHADGKFASFQKGLFQFVNDPTYANSQFISGDLSGPSADVAFQKFSPVGSGTVVQSYTNVLMELTSDVDGTTTVSPVAAGVDFYSQGLKNIKLNFFTTTSGGVKDQFIFGVTGTGSLSGLLPSLTTNFGADISLNNITYLPGLVSVPGPPVNYSASIGLTLPSELTLADLVDLGGGKYGLPSFTATGDGDFNVSSVPEFGTVAGFGMFLIGGGLLSVRKRRASK